MNRRQFLSRSSTLLAAAGTLNVAFAGANVLGVVLNRVDIHHPDHREYSRYYFSYEKVEEISGTACDDQRSVELTN